MPCGQKRANDIFVCDIELSEPAHFSHHSMEKNLLLLFIPNITQNRITMSLILFWPEGIDIYFFME